MAFALTRPLVQRNSFSIEFPFNFVFPEVGAGATAITSYTQLESLMVTEGENYSRFEAYLVATGQDYTDLEAGTLTEEAVAAWWTANP